MRPCHAARAHFIYGIGGQAGDERGRAIADPQKEAMVAQIMELLGRHQVALVTDYRGLSVQEMTALRRQLRDAGAEYHVVKNTMLRRALESMGMSVDEEYLVGPIALALAEEDPTGPAKAISTFAKQRGIPTVKCGMVKGRVFGAEDAAAFADLPGRQQLLAMVAACYRSPAANLVQTLYTLVANLAGTLQALAAKRASAAA